MKVLTFNLRNYTDDHWKERLHYIAKILCDIDPDVAAFQEVRGINDDPCCQNMAQQVRALCPGYLSLVTVPAMCYAGQGVWEGLSIMSKWTVADWLYEQLTWTKSNGNTDWNRRVMVWAKFLADGGALWISNNHFAVPDDPTQQMQNVTEVLEALGGIVDGPALLVGDLNALPQSDVWNAIDEDGWTDLWDELRPGEDGGTYPTEATPQHGVLEERIDYLWANPAFMSLAHDVSIRRVFMKRDSSTDLFASDHVGVLMEFGF